MNVEQHNDPWASYLKEKQNFELGTTSKTFTFKFQMTAATDTNSRLSFNAGAATGTLTLDNVKIAKTEAPADTGTTALRGVQFVREQPAAYAVFDLRGHRLGTLEMHDATEAETLLHAGYTKGVDLLRGLKGEKSLLVPVSR